MPARRLRRRLPRAARADAERVAHRAEDAGRQAVSGPSSSRRDRRFSRAAGSSASTPRVPIARISTWSTKARAPAERRRCICSFRRRGINEGSRSLTPGGADADGMVRVHRAPGHREFLAGRRSRAGAAAGSRQRRRESHGSQDWSASRRSWPRSGRCSPASHAVPASRRTRQRKHTVLRSSEPVLAHLMELEHH